MASSTNPVSEGNFRIAGASLFGLIVFWWAAAVIAGRPDLLPTPLEVGGAIAREAADGDLFFHLFATLARVLAAFLIAMAVGSFIGIVMGMRRRVDRWGDPLLVTALNLPALVTIVLCYIWIGLTEVAAVTAVSINKIPLVATVMREGARTLDRDMGDMASVFEMPPGKRLRHIIIPQLAPDFAAAARTGVALIWKIVLVVEFLGRSNGVGFQIHLHFQNFDVTQVLAYSLSFVAVMIAIELMILQPWQRHAARWRLS
jgi:NitT/TauT family transport system permease protein